MFTGLIQSTGDLLEFSSQPLRAQARISHRFESVQLGESISVNGICLTVVKASGSDFEVELSRETLEKSCARHWQVGQKLNLERSMRLGDRLGGHWVTGHVDGVARLTARRHFDGFIQLDFSVAIPDAELFLVSKGSIALDGVSLTLNEVDRNSFQVMIIPETSQRTTLAGLEVGDRVNVELDSLAKIVVHALRHGVTGRKC